jgi:hypothetical protein
MVLFVGLKLRYVYQFFQLECSLPAMGELCLQDAEDSISTEYGVRNGVRLG